MISLLLVSVVADADSYSELTDKILKAPKDSYISRLSDERIPDDYDDNEWNARLLKAEKHAEDVLSEGGELFIKIEDIFRNYLSPDEMLIVLKKTDAVATQDMKTRLRKAISESKEIMISYILGDLHDKKIEILYN